jgi:carboxylesterase type B
LKANIATFQFKDLCTALDIPLDLPTSEKLARLRAIPGQQLLDTTLKLKIPSFRATLDDIFISKNTFKWIHSGELAHRFKNRNMKLLIGEVEHEEAMYSVGAPTTQDNLLPSLGNYYPSAVSNALINHYPKVLTDVAEAWTQLYTNIVTDVQVRATTRAFSKVLADGGVPVRNILRYRISMPIKSFDVSLPPQHVERFQGKVPHAFDFLHWWYVVS